MLSQILAALGRIAVGAVLYLERVLPLLVPAAVAAYLFGKNFGYRGAALRLFVATGTFVAVVGTPAAASALGLDINVWQTAVCCGLAVYAVKGVKWLEAWIIKRLGFDRRDFDEGEPKNRL